MTVAVGDLLRVVCTQNWTDGNIVQNVFNAEITAGAGPFADADIVDDAVAWMDNIWANLVATISDELDGVMVQVYVYDVVGLDWDEVGTDPFTFNPSQVAEQLPRAVAALANVKTTDPDISGKKYVAGITEAQCTDGLWAAALITALANWVADWITQFVGGTSGGTWTPGIWSPTDSAQYAMSGSYILGTIPAYQRRRKRGVGI